MQDFDKPFREELTNFAPPPPEPSLLQFSFILESGCTQPMIIYHATPSRGARSRRVHTAGENIEAQLAEYVERMAGTEFDLDRTLENASIQHLMLLMASETRRGLLG